MGVWHLDKISQQLQTVDELIVKDRTRSSWEFSYKDAKASVRVLPGCCGILLFYQISGDKNALRLLQHAVRAATKAGFGLFVLSLRTDSPLRKRLGPEWNSTKFENPRTRNSVELLSYLLPTKVKPVKPNVRNEDN